MNDFDIIRTFKDYSSVWTLYNEFREVCGHNDWVFLYIAGHGRYENSESKIWIGNTNAVMSSDILALYNNPGDYHIPCKHLLIVVDGCYAGDFKYELADDPKVTVVTSTSHSWPGRAEHGSWGHRGCFTHDFFYGISNTICTCIFNGHSIWRTFDIISMADFRILRNPQYSDSSPSDNNYWFRW